MHDIHVHPAGVRTAAAGVHTVSTAHIRSVMDQLQTYAEAAGCGRRTTT